MVRADRVDDALDASFARGAITPGMVAASRAALDAGRVPAELMAAARESLHGGTCGLCGAVIERGRGAKTVASFVPAEPGDRYLVLTARTYCGRCFVAVQRHAEA